MLFEIYIKSVRQWFFFLILCKYHICSNLVYANFLSTPSEGHPPLFWGLGNKKRSEFGSLGNGHYPEKTITGDAVKALQQRQSKSSKWAWIGQHMQDYFQGQRKSAKGKIPFPSAGNSWSRMLGHRSVLIPWRFSTTLKWCGMLVGTNTKWLVQIPSGWYKLTAILGFVWSQIFGVSNGVSGR